MRVLPDTSLMVASLLKNHVHHGRAIHWLQRVVSREIVGVLAAHSLAEIYSTLTRMPLPNRLPPELAWEAIKRNLSFFDLATLTEAEVVAVLADLSTRKIGGGQVYDALIAAVARKADVDVLLTFNVPHFRLVAPDLAERILSP